MFFKGIIAKQFRDLKFGDRFYFENGHDETTRFTIEQLDQVRNSNMARILCDNVDMLYVQRNPFLKKNHETNPLVSCDKIPRVSFQPWKQKKYDDDYKK